MAKQSSGYLGGFSGRLGPAVGYLWNGKWCVRSYQPVVRNPRTAAQVAHRSLFKQQVQLAARMRWVVTATLTDAARAAGMTSYNLFVSLNQPAFRLEDSRLAVDWAALQLSVGPVAPVGLTTAAVETGNVLSVSFEKNPLGLAARSHDEVRLYVYAPAAGRGYLSAPTYRRDKRLRVSLPDELAGEELQLWLMVRGERGEWSPSTYGGSLVAAAGAVLGSGTQPDGFQKVAGVACGPADRGLPAGDAAAGDGSATTGPLAAPPRLTDG